MADEADIATDYAQRFTEAALTNRPVIFSPPETGECLSCGMPLKGRRWCDASCRDEWQADQK